MSDSIQLATLIMVAIILFILIVLVLIKMVKHSKNKGVTMEEQKFMSDPNLFHKSKREWFDVK